MVRSTPCLWCLVGEGSYDRRMPSGLLPLAAPNDAAALDSPEAVVEAFLAAMAAGDAAGAAALIADDILYVNMGLPAIRGRAEVEKVLALLDRPEAGFEVYLHSISSDGPVVLTERTDVLLIGRLRLQFWVWGRFDVHDGKITLWRDSFDFLDMAKATVRGLLALAVPALQPAPPTGADAVPGR
jgi:limonene-1,2-epoxide hydrolase